MPSTAKFVALGTQATFSGNSWLFPENITQSDTVTADCLIQLSDPDGPVSDYLVGRMQGDPFAIPSDAYITGLRIALERQSDQGGIQDFDIRFLRAGAAVGNNLSTGIFWPFGGLAFDLIGGDGELAGLTDWTAAHINDPDFGFQILCQSQNIDVIDDTARVDSAIITVFWAVDDPKKAIIEMMG